MGSTTSSKEYWIEMVPGSAEAKGHHGAWDGPGVEGVYQARLDHARRILQAGRVRFIFVSGGSIDPKRPDYNEGYRGRAYFGAGNGSRTRDPQLGKTTKANSTDLHQVTIFRKSSPFSIRGFAFSISVSTFSQPVCCTGAARFPDRSRRGGATRRVDGDCLQALRRTRAGVPARSRCHSYRHCRPRLLPRAGEIWSLLMRHCPANKPLGKLREEAEQLAPSWCASRSSFRC